MLAEMKMMQSFQEVRTDYGYLRRGIFKVPTSVGDVYMSVARTNYRNSERAVVEVEREKFFDLWCASPYYIHATEACGNKVSWQADRKFSYATRGFSSGVENPVPLAEVNFAIHQEATPVFERRWLILKRYLRTDTTRIPYVSFTNGVTRTIWLATFDAPYFPVECCVTEAEGLHRQAGTAGSSWATVEQLVPEN